MGRHKKIQPDRSDLIEFIERVRARNYQVSDYELFVELIGLFQKYISINKWDNKKPKDQLYLMWRDLEKLYEAQTIADNFHSNHLNKYWFNKKTRKYRSTIKVNNKTIYLGYYDTPEEAHEAYKYAEKKIKIQNEN
jgi:hypothetical protein